MQGTAALHYFIICSTNSDTDCIRQPHLFWCSVILIRASSLFR